MMTLAKVTEDYAISKAIREAMTLEYLDLTYKFWIQSKDDVKSGQTFEDITKKLLVESL